jgi:hypothetical protein
MVPKAESRGDGGAVSSFNPIDIAVRAARPRYAAQNKRPDQTVLTATQRS